MIRFSLLNSVVSEQAFPDGLFSTGFLKNSDISKFSFLFINQDSCFRMSEFVIDGSYNGCITLRRRGTNGI